MSFVVSAVVAVEGAIAVTTVASVLSAVAAVGAAMTVVGTVTKSKELVSTGKVLGLVGGIGSLANGVLTGLTATAAEAGVAEGASAGAYSDVAGEQFAQSVGQDAAGSSFSNAASAAANGGASGFTTTPIDMGPNGSPTGGIIGGAQAPVPTGVVSGAPDLSAAPSDGMTKLAVPDAQVDTSAGAATGQPAMADPMSAGDVSNLANTNLPTTASGIEDLAQTYGTDQGTFDGIKAKVGKAWDSMSPQMKMELVKSALAIPGGIQTQKNSERNLDIAQQNANTNAQNVTQHSYGNQVPTFGIINRAMKG